MQTGGQDAQSSAWCMFTTRECSVNRQVPHLTPFMYSIIHTELYPSIPTA